MEKAAEATERILVCLSSSPSNHKVISAAVKMAEAFHAALTAIYVKTERYDALSDADKARLQKNTRLAEQNGAFVTTVIGNDVAFVRDVEVDADEDFLSLQILQIINRSCIDSWTNKAL